LRLGSAAALGKLGCQRCGACCWKRPGRLSREDLERVAAHLGVSCRDVVRQSCVVDEINGVLSVLFVRWHQMNLAGGVLPARERLSLASSCTWLEGNHCRIYEARPAECRRAMCWIPNHELRQELWRVDDLLALGFNLNPR